MTTLLHPLTNLLATIGDPDGTRTITSIIALLVALGLALAMVAVWLHRTTRPDPELLAPLEKMGERKWRRGDPVGQRRTLDEARPKGAHPLNPSAAPPTWDTAFDAGPTGGGFDDLHRDAPQDPETDDAGPGFDPVVPIVPPTSATAEATPQLIDRPNLDDFADDIDPEVLATAEAELDAELHRRSDGG